MSRTYPAQIFLLVLVHAQASLSPRNLAHFAAFDFRPGMWRIYRQSVVAVAADSGLSLANGHFDAAVDTVA